MEEVRREFFRVLKKTRNEHFWMIVEESLEKGKVWDFLPWLRPRPSPAQIALKKVDGTLVESLEETWGQFHNHFTKMVEIQVDTMLDYPQVKTCEW